MAEKEQQNGYIRSGGDTEAVHAHSHDAREQRKKKRTKCLLYIVLFIIFQTGIITLFALTVMKVRTPKFRIREATLSNFNAGTPASPSLTARMSAEFSVKNANFGRYKYRDTNVVFTYFGVQVGQVYVPNSRANWRSTRKFNVDLDLNFDTVAANPQLSSDLRAGVVAIRSQAKLRGRVELMFVMKKNRATDMDCTMEIVTASQQIRNIVCK